MPRKTFTVADSSNESNAIRLGAFERPVAFIIGSDTAVADQVAITIGETSSTVLATYDSAGALVAFPFMSDSRIVFDNTEFGGGAYYKLKLIYDDGTSAVQSGNSCTIYMETREFNW